MKLPSKVRIAGLDYKITPCDYVYHKRRYAEFDATGREIRIDGNPNNHYNVLDTLLHEIMHGIYWGYNIKDEDEEERTVTAMATGLSQVLLDNPDLVKWIVRETKK